MSAGNWVVHDSYDLEKSKGDLDSDTDVYKVILCASTSNVATTSVIALGSVTNELATANGYTAGGATSAIAVTQLEGVSKYDFADVSWTAAGGNIVARLAALINTTTSTVVAHILLDDTPADITAIDGNVLTLTFDAAGAFTVQRAA